MQAAAQKTARALERALPFLRRALGQRLRLRRVPELTFAVDESIGHQARVEELLEQIKREEARTRRRPSRRPRPQMTTRDA